MPFFSSMIWRLIFLEIDINHNIDFSKFQRTIWIKMKKVLFLVIISSLSIYAQIKFDADFESGNLASVTTTDSINFFVRSTEDIGGRWFYFRIANVKDKFIHVEIENSDVNRPFYSYDNKIFVRFTQTESPQINHFQKTFEKDTVYVAYYIPYNFSLLQERISNWSSSDFVKVDTLGFTDHNLPMQEIIITDFSVPDENKKKIWIHARTHPGETPSSWHLDGIIETLLDDDEVISHYRKNLIFYIYPFNNPEGVYYGRSRTNYYGVDQERDWNYSPESTTKEVSILKNRMIEINQQSPISVFLNLHSQAAPFCTFWIHTAASTSDYFYRREYQFSNLNTSDNPYFRQDDYSESSLKSYFPEGWLWNNFNDKVMALTYETPYDRYSNDDWVSIENLAEIGKRTVYAIAEYLELSHDKHLILDNKYATASGNFTSSQAGVDFYSDDYLLLNADNGNSEVIFTSPILQPGKYDIYGWWQSGSNFSSMTNFEISAGFDTPVNIEKTQQVSGGQWNFLTEYQINSASNLDIKIKSNPSGLVAADAFRIIFREPILSAENSASPENFLLFQNYPNPFNPSTTIKYSIPIVEAQNSVSVQLKVYDVLGREVATLVDEQKLAGTYQVKFDASGLSSGIYFYRITILLDKLTTSNGFSATRKMILLR